VIGDRAYGDNADVVTRMSSACVRGHLTEKVEACVKHFPGHGDTHLDSHLALPTVTTDLETLRKREWIPFHRAMKSGCNYVMSAHVMLPHLDAEHPGTLSAIFLKKYLRQELQFQGVIVSDDMQMNAITENYGKAEAPLLALEAGCDLLIYRSEKESLLAIEAIKKAIQDKRLSAELVKKAIDRNREIRKRMVLAKNTLTLAQRLAMIGNEENRAIAAKITTVNATVDPTTRLP
jgi:beta-N-acetylhexosaminidase